MKKSLILIFVVLMALLVSSMVTAQEPAAVSVAEITEDLPVSTEGPAKETAWVALVSEEGADLSGSSEETEEPEVTEAPSEEPTEGSSETLNAADVPADTPSETPAEEIADTPDAADVPADTPSETPAEEIADTPDAADVPADTPSETPAEEIADTPDAADVPADTPSETPADEIADTPDAADTPSETTEQPEVIAADPSETPEETAAPEVTDTPSETPSEEITDTPTETVIPSDTPDATDEPTDTPDATDEPTDTPDATEEAPKSKVIFTITGKQETIEEDGEPHTAEGYTVVVSCENLETCPYTASDVKFIGESLPKAELTEAGKQWMGLDAEQFTSEIEDVDIIEIIVVDGYLEITAKPVVIEETTEPTEEITAEPTEEITEEPTEEITEEPTEEPTETEPAAEPTPEEPTVVVPEPQPEVRTSMLIIYTELRQTPKPTEEQPTETEEATEPAADAEVEETAEPTEEATEPTEDAEVEQTVEPTEEMTEPTEDAEIEPTAEPTEEAAEPADDTDVEETVEPTEEVTEAAEDTEIEETAEPTETADGEFQTIFSVETVAPTEETEPTAEVTETPAAETTLTLSAESVIFTGADETSAALFTTAGDTEVTVLSIDEETGWALVELADGTQGYIQIGAEEAVEEEPLIATVASATNIRLAADGMSAIFLTPADDMEVTILGQEGDWVKVALEDGTIGYIYINDIEFEGKEPKTYTGKNVTIFSTFRSIMEEGEPITLTSLLEGFEDCIAIKYQWECDKGSGFEPVEGGDSDSYTYEATAETMTWSWRLVVYYK